MKVFILANCRKLELWPATEMVFKSIRTGFPTATIHVTVNIESLRRNAISKLCEDVGALRYTSYIEHPVWIKTLFESELTSAEPFYLCDTDVSFWDNIEEFDFSGYPLAGRYVRLFNCEFVNRTTMPRLHTSLLYVNPPRLRAALAKYKEKFPQTVYTPSVDLFSPAVVPGIGFYDGAAMLYAAVDGYRFTERELECYDHVQCGCISDIVGPHIGDGKMQERHKLIFENPQLLKGQWRRDEQWFKERAA